MTCHFCLTEKGFILILPTKVQKRRLSSQILLIEFFPFTKSHDLSHFLLFQMPPRKKLPEQSKEEDSPECSAEEDSPEHSEEEDSPERSEEDDLPERVEEKRILQVDLIWEEIWTRKRRKRRF